MSNDIVIDLSQSLSNTHSINQIKNKKKFNFSFYKLPNWLKDLCNFIFPLIICISITTLIIVLICSLDLMRLIIQ
jgi:hypothetical protein